MARHGLTVLTTLSTYNLKPCHFDFTLHKTKLCYTQSVQTHSLKQLPSGGYRVNRPLPQRCESACARRNVRASLSILRNLSKYTHKRLIFRSAFSCELSFPIRHARPGRAVPPIFSWCYYESSAANDKAAHRLLEKSHCWPLHAVAVVKELTTYVLFFPQPLLFWVVYDAELED